MSFDARGTPKTLSATRAAEGLAISWVQPCYQIAEFKQTHDIGVTTFRASGDNTMTDWRDAADIYKRWAVKQTWCRRTLKQRDDLPSWLRAGPAMVRFNRTWLSRPQRIERWLKEYWKKCFPDNTPLVIAYWGWEKVDTWITPDYFPVYPSDAAFRHLTAVGHSIGGHSFLWPSGYHYTLTYKKQPNGRFAWDDRERFDAVARAHAICNAARQVALRKPSWLRGGQTATMCPGDPWTRDWVEGRADFTLPKGTQLLRIMLHINGPGRVWIDDMTLLQVHADGAAVEVPWPNKPSDHVLMHEWVKLFHGAGRPYLLQGTMLHPPALTTKTQTVTGRSFPTILHNAFRAPDGSQATVLVNWTTSSQTGQLDWNGKRFPVTLEPQEITLLRE